MEEEDAALFPLCPGFCPFFSTFVWGNFSSKLASALTIALKLIFFEGLASW